VSVDEQLIGQEEMLSLLKASLINDKLSHAIMLNGPAGSGKKSWGRWLARSLLCPERQEASACLQCQSCRSFAADSHPDYFVIKPDGRKLKTAQIRNVKASFYLAGSKKVCLIEQADLMTAEACASLLKILEDPPADLTFILLTEQTRNLPDTIISRCQNYHLLPLPVDELAGLLCRNENLPPEKAQLLAIISAGLPGAALRLAADQDFDQRIEEARSLAYKLAVGSDPVIQLLNWAEQLAQKEDLLPILELLAMIYRDGLMQNLCRRGDRPDQLEQPSAWLEKIAPKGLEAAVLLLNQCACELLSTNVNRRLLLEKTLIMLQRRLTG
jgi:DNA polymerase III subunit delta'